MPARSRPCYNLVAWPFILLSVVLPRPASTQAQEAAILAVRLNTEPKGDHFVLVTPEGDVLLPADVLRTLGLKEARGALEVGGTAYVSLRALAPALEFSIDQERLALDITVDPHLLEKNVLDLAYHGPPNIVHVGGDSAVLNYGLSYSTGDGFDFDSFRLPWELAVNVGGLLGLSAFSYSVTRGDERLLRLATQIVRDDPGAARRILLGDVAASSGLLGSGTLLGGVSISKNFSLAPYFATFPALDVSGLLHTPSDVELYVNGVLVRSARAGPGELVFLNLPTVAGAGEATLVVRDALGREERVVTPIYRSRALLRSGLHDYGYNIGLRRAGTGRENFAYRDLTFVGYHRLGISDALTAGVRGEADERTVNVGPSTTFLLGRWGEAEVHVAVSDDHGRLGYGGAAGYSYVTRGVAGRFLVSGFSPDYVTLARATRQGRSRLEALVGLSYQDRALGSLTGTLSLADRYVGADVRRVTVAYSRGLARGVSLHVTAGLTQAETTSRSLFVGLNFLLGRNLLGGVTYQTRGNGGTETAVIQQSPPLGTGFGYRVVVDRQERSRGGAEVGAGTALQYKGPYGLYSLDYRRAAGRDALEMSASGAVVLVGDRSLHLTRPIADGFAVVKVRGPEGVGVYYSNERVGTTRRDGTVVVPNLISHFGNDLSIEEKDVPVNYRVSERRKFVSTSFRGGGVVEFEVTRLQGQGGRIFLVENGRKRAAEYAALEVRVGEQVVETVVGQGGEFYLENLPAGAFGAKTRLDGKECHFEIVIPKSDEMLVDLGEVICEVGR